MTDHTPGPWKVESAFRDISITGPHKKPIGTLSGRTGGPEEDGLCRGHSHNGMMANAHLIASAPDMLDALQMTRHLLVMIFEIPEHDKDIIQIDNALARAKGAT